MPEPIVYAPSPEFVFDVAPDFFEAIAAVHNGGNAVLCSSGGEIDQVRSSLPVTQEIIRTSKDILPHASKRLGKDSLLMYLTVGTVHPGQYHLTTTWHYDVFRNCSAIEFSNVLPTNFAAGEIHEEDFEAAGYRMGAKPSHIFGPDIQKAIHDGYLETVPTGAYKGYVLTTQSPHRGLTNLSDKPVDRIFAVIE